MTNEERITGLRWEEGRPRAMTIITLLCAAGWLIAPAVYAAAPAVSRFTAKEFGAALLTETNRVRQENGVPRLKPRPELDAAADDQAVFMVATLSAQHASPIRGEEDVEERVRRHGLEPTFVAENVAAIEASRKDAPHSVQSIASALVATWMASPGHRANLLSPQPTHLGGSVRLVHVPGDVWIAYGAQVFFAGSRPPSPRPL